MGIQINGNNDIISALDGSWTAEGASINTSGILTATTFKGNIVGTAATFTGPVTIGGTLTYEDVTNIDSVGLITARNGVQINGNNKYLKIGASNELGFVHTGSETFITNSTGHFTRRSDVHKWENYAGNSEYARFTSAGKLIVGANAATNGSIAEFSKSVGSGANGCHITVENTSTDSVNNTAGYHCKTNNGVAKFYAFSAPETYLQSRVGGTADLLLAADGASKMRFYTNSKERLRITSSGYLRFSDTNDPWDNNADIFVSYDVLNFNAYGASGAFVFKSGSSSTERLRIDTSGQVGIGTWAPQQKLDVRGSTVFGIDQVSGNPGTTVGITTIRGHHVNSEGDYARLYFSNSKSAGGGITPTASIRGIRVGDNYGTSLSFYTNSTGSAGDGGERLRIDNTGKTTSYGQIALSAGGAERFNISHTSGGNVLVKNPTGANITFQIQNNSDQLQLHNNGKVGMGIGSPDGKLHVHSSSAGTVTADGDADELTLESSGNTGMSILSPGDKESSIYFGNPGTNGQKDGWIKYYHETHGTVANRRSLRFATGGNNEKLCIASDGKIGFGDFSTGTGLLYSLHFKNAMSSSPSWIHMEVTGSNAVGGGGGIAFDTSASNNATNNSLYLATIAGVRNSLDNGSNDLVFSTSTNGVNSSLPVEKLRITSDGLLGLNVTPSYSGLFGGSQKGMHIGGTTAPFLRITSSTGSQGDLILQAGNSGGDVQMGNLNAGGDIVFWNKTSGGSLAERLRIHADGRVTTPVLASSARGGIGLVGAFMARVTSVYDFPAGTRKIILGTEEFDANGWYDTSNYRYTPLVKGWYQLHFHLQFKTGITGNSIEMQLYPYFNGASTPGPVQGWSTNYGNYAYNSWSTMMYFDGVNDYVEMYGNCSTTTDVSTATRMMGYLVHPVA